MPKMKTHSGAKKRFRLTGSGHVKSEGSRRQTPHKMSNKQRRVARMSKLVKPGMGKRIRRMLVVA